MPRPPTRLTPGGLGDGRYVRWACGPPAACGGPLRLVKNKVRISRIYRVYKYGVR